MSELAVKRGRGHKSKGTHGSLSKAGKTRGHSPRRWDRRADRKSKAGTPFKHRKKHKSPKCSNKQRFYRRVVLGREGNTHEES